MRSRLGLVISCLAVLSAGRFLAGEVRGFAERESRAELAPRLEVSLDRWIGEWPSDAVLRFEAASESPTAGPRLAQLRFRLAPRRVVRRGEADAVIVEASRAEIDGRGDLVVLDELDEGLWLCRRRR